MYLVMSEPEYLLSLKRELNRVAFTGTRTKKFNSSCFSNNLPVSSSLDSLRIIFLK